MPRCTPAILAAFLAVLCVGASLAAAAEPAASPASKEEPFDVVADVLLSPRCRNCHPAGDRPLQYDDGRVHAQEVGRQATRLGLDCSACHQAAMPVEPMAGPNVPPGAPHWGLPPEETPMVFEGRSPAQLCAQLKDPEQTGGKDLAGLLHHVSEDALVAWGWNPGEGRTPVPVPRDEFLAGFRAWIDAGAPCPEAESAPAP